MQYLCAPWRSEYFSNKKDTCPFCDALKYNKDDELGILFRAKNCFGVMNLFPYSPGAFMIIPNSHTDNIESLSLECWQEISFYVQKGVKILKENVGAQGVNIGMNLGVASGAGISEHVHYHLVPRWIGDTNFITTIGGARVNGVPFLPLYEKIKKAFGEIEC